ncbi:hypothetical protein EDM56_07555 [Brevibacillus fluminis]|uniref:Lipoprotein n=1 Tax=Brevibacillus fluminis TaxID=511487 RepID=A0A3M8DSD7_9BACL|nr:hypothetical protein [Brevibacillus fluminis]RNB90361.1 hypothetical protein EDM56_07555 [Brevibacillus fluminis]
MFPKAIRRVAPVCLSVAFLLGGCTYPSDVKELKANTSTAPTDIGTPAGPLAVERLKKAIEKAETDPNAQKFWYTGYVKNTILSRTTTSMFDGIVSKPEGYLVNARIAAQPYQYYRYHDKTYLRNGDYWITAQEQPLSFDVWKGFDDWLPFLTNAVQLPSEKIMGVDTTPFQIKISGAQWLAGSNSDLFGDLKKEIADRPDMQELLKQSTIKTTIWVSNDGKTDSEKEDSDLIFKYQTWIIIPLPGAGYMDQEVNYTFFKYNDPGIKLPDISEVEKYLLY